MKLIKILVLAPVWLSFHFLAFPAISQTADTLLISKAEEKMIGVWKIDLKSQKLNLEPENREKINRMTAADEEQFWLNTESRVYVFEEGNRVTQTWVDRGVYNEKRGTWTINSATMVLTLDFWEESLSYKVNFNVKSMAWIPQAKNEEFLGVLILSSLFQ